MKLLKENSPENETYTTSQRVEIVAGLIRGETKSPSFTPRT